MSEEQKSDKSGLAKEYKPDNAVIRKRKGAIIDRPFVCKVCGKAFAYRSHLKYHTRADSGEGPYECQYCDTAFLHCWSLRRHMGGYSEDERQNHRLNYVGEQGGDTSKDHKPLKCKVCGRKFAKCSRLRRHIRIIHTRERLNVCEFCGKAFAKPYHLKAHKGEQPLKCLVCYQEFESRCSLHNHKRTHAQDKPYRCQCCAKSYGSVLHLIRHKCTGDDTREYKFKCEYCVKTFISSDSFINHAVTHTGEKLYECNVCEKRIASVGSLISMISMAFLQYGEKPYNCKLCDKIFAKPSELTYHARCDSGERPFKCNLCMKVLRWKQNLKVHMVAHTGDKPLNIEIMCHKDLGTGDHSLSHVESTAGRKRRLEAFGNHTASKVECRVPS